MINLQLALAKAARRTAAEFRISLANSARNSPLGTGSHGAGHAHPCLASRPKILHRFIDGGDNPRVTQLGNIDAHKGACGLRDTEYVARSEHDILFHAALRHQCGILTVRQTAPQIEPTAWDGPRNKAERRQQVHRIRHGNGTDCAMRWIAQGAEFMRRGEPW